MKTLLIAFGFFSMACSKPSADQLNLQANKWQLQQVGEIPVTANAPTLAFDENGKVNGNGGCNGYFSTFETKGNSLTINGIGSTEMACENIALEAQYFEWLAQAASYEIDKEGKLHISTKSGELIFKAMK